MWKVPLFDLNYDHREQEAVLEVLQSKWITSGPQTARFEDRFADFLGGQVKCVAVSSGTAALHMAMLVAAIGPGDEVILPGLTFVADLNVVFTTGATPILADSKSLEDWNISPDDVLRKITPRTKAVIAVHYAGYPCDMDAIAEICREKNLVLVEDAAHAVGADFNGKMCGTIGDIGCFSFFSNKNLAVGEGGMFVTSDPEYAQKARLMRSHGMTSMTIDRHQGGHFSYDVLLPGFNYRIDEIRSALGRVQLDKLRHSNHQRTRMVREYISQLKEISSIIIPWKNLPLKGTSAHHIFPILLPGGIDRAVFMNFLRDRGIQTSIHYPVMSSFSFYRGKISGELKIAEDIAGRVVTLPLFPKMTSTQVNSVVEAITDFFKTRES